ncbi:MAG: hypothetical protein K8T91_27830 [Planctomycetes bacterium]|nr:hypothetical protein [Planctomycetota bacterium]
MPPPMELPAPQLPKEDKPKAPEPMVPEPKEPDLKLPEPKQPEPQEPKKEPTDNLFEAPPRSGGDKNQNKGASLPERPSIRTTQAKGKWVAMGASTRNENGRQQEVAPASDIEETTTPATGRVLEPTADGQPARLPAHDEAIPLSGANRRPARGQDAAATGSATARFMPVHDAAVRPVSYTEPVTEGVQPLSNPLRRQ